MLDPDKLDLASLELFETLQDQIDDALQLPPVGLQAFTVLHLTTSVLAANIDGPRFTHKELIERLRQRGEPSGVVLAINSNYGAVSQPNYEALIKPGGKEQPLAPAGRKHRQPEGRGGSFNSALEPILQPAPGSYVSQQLAELGKPHTSYKVKYFPTRGSMQVSGVIFQDLGDGIAVINDWVSYLDRTQLLDGPASLTPGSIRPEMINYKFRLQKRTERQVINFHELYNCLLHEVDDLLPAPLIETALKRPSEGARASFKFDCGNGKTPRVNLFLTSGKINFLGFPSSDFAQQVYAFLNHLFSTQWGRFVSLRPLDDDAMPAQPDELTEALKAMDAHQACRLHRLAASVLTDKEVEETLG
jgi:hypothetical protein